MVCIARYCLKYSFNIFTLQTNIIMTGNDSDLGREDSGVGTKLFSDSSESWNQNRFWFMLVECESESFAIVMSGILKYLRGHSSVT